MKHKAIIIILAGVAVLVIGVGMAFKPPRAECWGCYDGPCYNSLGCGMNCVCLKQGLDLDGRCFSMQ